MKQPSVWWRNRNGKDTKLELVSPEGPFGGLLALKTSTSSLTRQQCRSLRFTLRFYCLCRLNVLATQSVSVAVSTPMFCYLAQQMASRVVVLVMEDVSISISVFGQRFKELVSTSAIKLCTRQLSDRSCWNLGYLAIGPM